MEQESAATKAAVEEAIGDLEALDAERTDLRKKLQVAPSTIARFTCASHKRRGSSSVYQRPAEAHKHRAPSESTAQTCD